MLSTLQHLLKELHNTSTTYDFFFLYHLFLNQFSLLFYFFKFSSLFNTSVFKKSRTFYFLAGTYSYGNHVSSRCNDFISSLTSHFNVLKRNVLESDKSRTTFTISHILNNNCYSYATYYSLCSKDLGTGLHKSKSKQQ